MCDVPSIDGMVVYGGNDGSGEQIDAHTMSFGSHVWTTVPRAATRRCRRPA